MANSITPQQFQSTLPAKGATARFACQPDQVGGFNPRSPRRERPGPPGDGTQVGEVSIHAPREGSDTPAPTRTACQPGFNPRSPRRERPPSSRAAEAVTGFNPRSPRRERHEAINLCFWQMKPGPLGNEKQGQQGHPVFSLAIKIRAVWQ